MRGKLRDKRADTRRDKFKRELLERRRVNKRDNRVILLNQQYEEDDDLLLEEVMDALAQKPVTK